MEMKDPSEEWEIEEYSHSEENKSKLSWILNKGLGLGKKIVVTGIVISSAPLVLPPLVVISAFGFAFSVPFGLIFASYAFTEKLMSKLLPGANHPPLLLDYGMLSEEEEEIDDLGFGGEIYMEKEEEEIGDLGFGREIDLETEEDEEIDDLGFGGEIDMEKEEEEQMEDTRGGVELPEENDYYGQMNEQESLEYVKESVKEEGYEEDGGEYLDLDSKESVEEIDVKIEGVKEEGEEVPEIKESKDDQSVVPRVVVLAKGDEKNDGNMSEVSEKVGDDRNFDNGFIENERMDKSPKTKNVKLQKLITKVEGTEEEESKDDDAVPEENGKEEIKRETTGLPEKIRAKGNVENILVVEKPVEEESNGRVNGRKPEGVEIIVEEEQKPSMDKKGAMPMQMQMQMQGMEAAKKDLKMEKEKESEINSNTDSKESANEILFTEEKIWEQIDAMRTIVGYKAAIHATCMGELKALYIFTGVEPPASFKDKADLVEVNAKLRFLMSVVGVK